MHVDFTISLGTIATLLTIIGTAWGIGWRLKKFQDAVSVGIWEHKVVWRWFEVAHKDKIPEYPRLP